MSSNDEARILDRINALKRRARYTRIGGVVLVAVAIVVWFTHFFQMPVSIAVIVIGLLMFLGIGFPTPRRLGRLQEELADIRRGPHG